MDLIKSGATLIVASLLALPGQGQAKSETASGQANVEVRFTELDPVKGTIWVSMCTKVQIEARMQGEPIACAFQAKVEATTDAVARFEEVPAGPYAVTAFHDENDDGELNVDTYGIPMEATGNSQSARGSFGPPTFEQMKTEIPATGEVSLNVDFYRVELPF